MEDFVTVYQQTGHRRRAPRAIIQDKTVLDKMTVLDFDLDRPGFREYVLARRGLKFQDRAAVENLQKQTRGWPYLAEVRDCWELFLRDQGEIPEETREGSGVLLCNRSKVPQEALEAPVRWQQSRTAEQGQEDLREAAAIAAATQPAGKVMEAALEMVELQPADTLHLVPTQEAADSMQLKVGPATAAKVEQFLEAALEAATQNLDRPVEDLVADFKTPPPPDLDRLLATVFSRK